MILQPAGCSWCGEECERKHPGRIQLCEGCWDGLRRGRADPVDAVLRCEWCGGTGLVRSLLQDCRPCAGAGRRTVTFTRASDRRDDGWDERERAWDLADFHHSQEMFR